MPAAATSTLAIVCGLPGSGKTTLALELESSLGALRLSSDDWMDELGVDLWDGGFRTRLERLQFGLIGSVLGLGGSVVVEWGTWTRAERLELLAVGRSTGARVELHLLDVPIAELHHRVAVRDREDPPITLDDLVAWHERFEWPDEAELARYDRAVHGS